MGNKDKTRDENAATDASRDQESRDAALARTIAEAVALQTKSIVEMFSNRRQKRHSHLQKHSKGRWIRHMCSMRSF